MQPHSHPGSFAPVPPPRRLARAWAGISAYFSEQDPRFAVAIVPALVVSVVVFTRSPAANFIFDEQEALLANPYVNGHGLGFLDAFRRDFWGLPPTRTIGSYRPIPDIVWWLQWHIHESPFFPHFSNVILHSVNAALLATFSFHLTKERKVGWLAGACFLLCAVVTEAVAGVVGLADVLGGLGVLLALNALRRPLYEMPVWVFLATLLGLFSKESVLVAIPLVCWVALVSAPALHPGRPWRLLRGLLALVATVGALVGYTYFRRHFFPVTLPAEFDQPLAASRPLYERAFHEFLRWFRQPRLPRDAINNPLVDADLPHRVAGALRVYTEGLRQVLLPMRLSGDYSYAQEPIPTRIVFPASVTGACLLVLPPLAAIVCWFKAWRGRSSWMIAAIGLMWVPIAYFPHSNIPTLLPTVRAERFWYLPAVGSSILLALALQRMRAKWQVVGTLFTVGFLAFQALQARGHALHYSNDLVFWRAATYAVPMSAKARLNYAVMVGARGDLDERLRAGARAEQIAPDWAMAHVYAGDTLCRLKARRGWNARTMAEKAWPEYARGFDLGPNDSNLIALALQCLWDQGALPVVRDRLLELSDKHPSSWLAYLADDIVQNGAKYNGVNPKYRPRGYNEGPKQH